MTPAFTVLIGSAGRDTLTASLASLRRQALAPDDQVVVAFDTYERDAAWLAEQARRVADFGFTAHAHDAGYHWYGVEQINSAMRGVALTGTHVLTIGDDDVYVDGAFAALRARCAAAPERPVMFRFLAPWRELLWDEPRMQMSRISGCCIAAPARFVGQFPTRQYVEHDFDWMQDVLERAAVCGHAPDWWDRVLVIARPDARGDDVTHRGLLKCWHCQGWRYLEDVDESKRRCPRCHVVLEWPQDYAVAG